MDVIVMGASYGGMKAIKTILLSIPMNFPIPIMIVLHLNPKANSYLAQYLNEVGNIEVKEAEDKEKIQAGYAYIAPPNYHMMIDNQGYIALDVDEKVNYARPSIDVLFETAAEAFGDGVIGVLLTGANSDGSLGMKKIKEYGGITIVQDPEEAEADTMPSSAIKKTKIDYVKPIGEIGKLLKEIVGWSE